MKHSPLDFRISRGALTAALVLASIVSPFASFQPTVAFADTDTATVGQVFTFASAGTTSWTVPSNVQSVKVTVWGAGGAGGNGTYDSGVIKAGQGGGAGGYASSASIAVTPGSSHKIIVGAGGSSTGTRNGGTSSFDSSVVATGGVGGANWDEIPDNGTLASTKCYFEGTWIYHDEGGPSSDAGANDFAVTCRSGKISGFCNTSGEPAGMNRGLNENNYLCEHGSAPTIGTKCDFDGTWKYDDQGSGNDFAVTCRNTKVTGWCTASTAPRGFTSGVYTCERGQPTTTSAPYCDFNGSWSYNDDGGGNDFAITCRDNKLTGWCAATPYDRGSHAGSYLCEAPITNQSNNGVPSIGGNSRQVLLNKIEKIGASVFAILKPAVAYAAAVYNGQGGSGTAGTAKHDGGDASAITNDVGGSTSSNGGSAYTGGTGGYHGRLGRDGQGTCSGTVPSGNGNSYSCTDALAKAQDGKAPGGGGGGSDTGKGGNGGAGKVVVQVVSLAPVVNQAPVAPTVTGPTTGDTSATYSFTAHAVDPEGDKVTYSFDWDNNGTIDESTAFVASGASASLSHSWATAGTYTFKVFAKDQNENLSPATSRTIVISKSVTPVVNKAPVLASVTGPATGFTATPYAFVALANDPEGDKVSYGFDWNNDNVIDEYTGYVASGASAQLSHSWSTPGTYTFKVFSKDVNENISNVITKTIVISAAPVVNVAPLAPTVTGSSTISVNTAALFSAKATDPEGDTVTYGFDWNNDNVIDQYSGYVASGVSAQLSHTWNATGTYSFKVFAKDQNENLSPASTFTVNVIDLPVVVVNGAPNTPFVQGPITGTTSESYSFSVSAVDPEGEDVRYGFDWNNDNVVDEYTGYASSSIPVAVSHSWATAGTYSFNVYAFDIHGNKSAGLSRTIDISAPVAANNIPVMTSVGGSTNGNTSVLYTFDALATDPDGDNVQYGFDWNNDGTIDESTAFVASGASVSLSHAWDTAGTYTFGVYALDNRGGKSNVLTHTISISNGPVNNMPPVISSVTGATTGFTTTGYTFTATAVDPEGDDVRYGFDWDNDGTVDEYTPYASSSVATSLSHSWSDVGAQTFNVRAFDTHGNSSAQYPYTITISPIVIANGAPTAPAISGPSEGTTTVSYEFPVVATDPDGDNVQYGFDWNNDGTIDESTAFVASGASASLSHTWNATGTFAYGVIARDVYGHTSATATADIVIHDLANDTAPTIVSIDGPKTGAFNTAYAFLATATDPDAGDKISYGFDWNDNGIIEPNLGEEWTDPVISGVSVSRSNSWVSSGEKVFRVIARDTFGAESFATSSISITGGPSNIDFVLSASSTDVLTTSESGSTASFTVVLSAAPLTDVVLPVASSDLTEGTTSVWQLVFTPSNWNTPQTVTVTGLDDSDVDGNIPYHVTVGPSVSSDLAWNGLVSQMVQLVNNDNDVAPTGSGPSGGHGGGGGGSGGPCFGYNCPTTSTTTTAVATSPLVPPDVMVQIGSIPTNTVSTPSAEKFCKAGEFITTYMRRGKDNNPDEVRKLQSFLNKYDGASLPLDGFFGTSTEDAVKAFQSRHSGAVLAPWGVTEPTGIVYITTTNEINRIFCGDNPNYTGDQNVLYPPTNSNDFNGLIGQATSTNTAGNLAAVSGALSQRVLGFIKDIPWYQILVALLILLGSGLIIQGIFIKDIQSSSILMSFMRGAAVLAVGSVLNVLNTLSFILNPDWLAQKTGLSLSWVLGLDALNGIAVIVVCLSALFSIYGKVVKIAAK